MFLVGLGAFLRARTGSTIFELLLLLTLLYAFAVAFLNVVVDVLYAYIDTRIRYS